MNNKKAEHLILISIIGALFLAALGIIWGTVADSRMIQFDGYYSFISVLLSLLSLMALRFIANEDKLRFPFGKETLIPLIIVVKYFGILVLIVISLVQAFISIFTGGNAVPMESGMVYAVIAAAGCYGAYFYFSKKGMGNDIISAEMNQWKMDALLSAGILAGFIIGWILGRTFLDGLVPFVDPIMVIAAAGYFIKVPSFELYNALRDLLEMSPKKVIAESVETEVSEVNNKYGFNEYGVRLQKFGIRLYVEVRYTVDVSDNLTIMEQDAIRNELKKRLGALTSASSMSIIFTHERPRPAVENSHIPANMIS